MHEDLVKQLEMFRTHILGMIDSLEVALQASASDEESGESLPIEVPLTLGANFFKGKRPAAVIFSDGHLVEATTWRAVSQVILTDCYASCSDNLCKLRGILFGRYRLLLADTPDGMDQPIKIAEDMFFEGKLGTETLLHVITERILIPVGYDPKGISIRLR